MAFQRPATAEGAALLVAVGSIVAASGMVLIAWAVRPLPLLMLVCPGWFVEVCRRTPAACRWDRAAHVEEVVTHNGNQGLTPLAPVRGRKLVIRRRDGTLDAPRRRWARPGPACPAKAKNRHRPNVARDKGIGGAVSRPAAC